MRKIRINELIEKVIQQLIALNYSKSTIASYWRIWTKLQKWMINLNIYYLDPDIGLKFIKRCNQYSKKALCVSINHLLKFLDMDSISLIKQKRPNIFGQVLEEFLSSSKIKETSSSNIISLFGYTNKFLVFICEKGIINLNDLTKNLIVDFFKKYNYLKKVSLYKVGRCIKLFLVYLYEKDITKVNYSIHVPVFKCSYNSIIPSVYTNNEIKLLLASIDISTNIGKRDYAMLLFAYSYGLREKDIRDLQLKNINWDSNTIILIQSKTKK